jgi:soluble lytic murein transglycosylase
VAAFGLASPAAAGPWGAVSGNADWQRSQLVNDPQPLARKLALWLRVTETDKPMAVRDMMNFALQNPHWPRLHIFRRGVENDIKGAGLKPAETAAWFDQNPPRTADAFSAYMSALSRLGDAQKAAVALKKFWTGADVDRKETASLAREYKSVLSAADHAGRMDNLLWEDRFREAEYMMPLVDADTRRLAEARIALGRLSSEASKLLSAVPVAKQSHPGLLYNRLRWRRVKDLDGGAAEILRQMPPNPPHPELWWKERNILARRAIEKHDYSRAARIVSGHGMTPRNENIADYAAAEWMLGWLQLEFLGQPDKAYRHFEDFYSAVTSAVSRSRGAWWLARAATKMQQKENEANWLKIAAQFPSTFFGQLAHEKLHGPARPDLLPDEVVLAQDEQTFSNDELVKAVRLLERHGLKKHADPFLLKLLERARTRADFILTARLARKLGRTHMAVEANKQIQMKIGSFLFSEGYPLLPALPVNEPESALVHAIMHRESMFNTEAGSSAGARGLMQLMPGTAQQVSRRLGKNYHPGKLTGDPRYNIELGSAYLQQLLEDYDGFYPMAIAAYNAGPGNVNKWVRTFGDPRSKRVDLLDWIEQIPIYETRNYIQRVMESYYIYKLRLNEKPETILAFK